ncbi:MAG: hypothetical protein ACREXV_16575 [Polaromonas sp.]
MERREKFRGAEAAHITGTTAAKATRARQRPPGAACHAAVRFTAGQQEQFGPHIGANPIALLSVIGRNMVGRLQVAAAGAALDEPAHAIEVTALLKGDNSEAAFAELVRQHATSGVSD